MLKKLLIFLILALILGFGVFFVYEKPKPAAIKETSTVEVDLKDEGKALCDAGKLKEGEAKLEEAIKIISFTMMN